MPWANQNACRFGFAIAELQTNATCTHCNGRSFNTYEFTVSGITDVSFSNADAFNGTFVLNRGTFFGECSWMSEEVAVDFDGSEDTGSNGFGAGNSRWLFTRQGGEWRLLAARTDSTALYDWGIYYRLTTADVCGQEYVLSRVYASDIFPFNPSYDNYDAPATVTIRAV